MSKLARTDLSLETFRIAYDIKRMRPGCVLLQAALGGTVPRDLFNDLFPNEVWETGAGDMHVYTATRDQLEVLARKSKPRHK